jgi:hypothetical protein
MRTWIAVAVGLFFSLAADAATIRRIDPASIPEASGEHFLNITGSNLGDLVIFEGPAGKFELEHQGGAGNDSVTVWVPVPVVNSAGVYSILTRGKDGDSNAVRFEVVPMKQPLVVLGQDPIVVRATSREGAKVEFEVHAVGGEDPNPVVTCDPKSGSQFPIGPSHVRCVATNRFGERAEGGVYIFVQDAYGPVVTVPDDIVVEAEDESGAVVTFTASAKDEFEGEVPVTCEPKSGSRFTIGVTEVQCVAYDGQRNEGIGSFTVEVRKRDGGGGTLLIQVPQPITVEATDSAGAQVRFTVAASGTDDPDPEISCDPASESTFPVGKTRVQCSATDKYGNRAAGEFDVTVTDTTAPVLLVRDLTVEATGDSAQVLYAPVAEDLVDGSVAVDCTPPSGTRFPLGTFTVQCVAVDARGNQATASFTVQVIDSGAPHIISVRADPDVLSPANHKLVDVNISVHVVDGTDAAPQCRVATVHANEAIDAPGSGATDVDWMLTGPLALQLRAERSGPGTDRIYTVFVSCFDTAGNQDSANVRITVPKGNTAEEEAIPKKAGRRRSVRP